MKKDSNSLTIMLNPNTYYIIFSRIHNRNEDK